LAGTLSLGIAFHINGKFPIKPTYGGTPNGQDPDETGHSVGQTRQESDLGKRSPSTSPWTSKNRKAQRVIESWLSRTGNSFPISTGNQDSPLGANRAGTPIRLAALSDRTKRTTVANNRTYLDRAANLRSTTAPRVTKASAARPNRRNDRRPQLAQSDRNTHSLVNLLHHYRMQASPLRQLTQIVTFSVRVDLYRE